VTFGLEIRLELSGLPVTVWRPNLGVPVALDEFLKICAICRCRIWDVVVTEPALEFGFVPFVVS